MISKVDSHVHVWTLARGDYHWLTPKLATIYRDYSLNDVWSEAQNYNVKGVILVQAAASDAETDFLLSIAEQDRRVLGVVGWADFEGEKAAVKVRSLAQHPRLCGLRPMIGDIADPDWILEDERKPALQVMADTELVFDAHAKTIHLSRMAELAARFPSLQIVLDHAGKPPIASGDLKAWTYEINRLAESPNVSCKLSGFMTEAGKRSRLDDLRPIFEVIHNAFGVERLIWGSDWPFMEQSSDYRTWADLSDSFAAALPEADQDRLFRMNAYRIYNLIDEDT